MTLHNLEIRVCKNMTLEEVELLKDHIWECIMSSGDIVPRLGELEFEIEPEQIDLIVLDSQD